MENRLIRLHSMLSLKEMASRRIGVLMCNKLSILNKIAFPSINEYDICYRDLERNLSNLPLPESLKEQMTPILKATCDEIARWKFFHEEYFCGGLSLRVFKTLRWTTAGTVNYQKTAEELVRSSDELQDVSFRFQLACLYCLEDYIPALWRELPVESKKGFIDGDISQIKEPHLEFFLPNILRRAESKFRHNTSSHYLDLAPRSNYFERAARLGNVTLINYYLSKLSKEDKEATLVPAAKAVMRLHDSLRICYMKLDISLVLSSVFCFLLSLMTAEEQNRIFREMPCEVFSCFFYWPRQNLFLDIADVMWTFIPESKYEHLLRTLDHALSVRNFHFPDLFQEFFHRSPVNFRKRFVDYNCGNIWIFNKFMCNEDTETIRVLLKNLYPSDRVRLVFSRCGLDLIYWHKNKWPVMEVFLRELHLTRQEKRRLKKAITEVVRKRGRIKRINEVFGRVFKILDEGEASAGSKRSSEDETSTEVKRLCFEKEENSS